MKVIWNFYYIRVVRTERESRFKSRTSPCCCWDGGWEMNSASLSRSENGRQRTATLIETALLLSVSGLYRVDILWTDRRRRERGEVIR